MLKQILCACLAGVSVFGVCAERSPSDIIQSAPSEHWRSVEPENLLILSLATGEVYLELNPALAPKHSERLQHLAKAGFYQDKSMYRFVEGFVAQGGAGEQTTSYSELANEFVKVTPSTQPLDIIVNESDGYAAHSGFINGFAVAQNAQGTHTWQIHCPGALGMARGNEVDSASTEFYVVLGHAPRYLDKNITVFGRVISGMAHLQQLQRAPSKDEPFNPILDMRLASELPQSTQPSFEVMRTDSTSFYELVQSRRNRPEAWFVDTPNFIDTCAMSVPYKKR